MFGLGRIRDRYYRWCESVKFLSRNKGMRAGKTWICDYLNIFTVLVP